MERAKIQSMLEEFQSAYGETPHVYFQPPDNAKIIYPCFVYTYSDIVLLYSNGNPYLKSEEYIVKYITKKAQPDMLDGLLLVECFRFDRHYTSDGLHHYSFVLSTPYSDIDPKVDLSSIKSKYLGG